MPPALPLSSRPGPTTSFASTTASTTSSTAPQTLATHTHRASPWTYIHLRLHASPAGASPPALDALTARQHLTAALRRHLGAHGAAAAVDVLAVRGADAWVRVPGEDGAGVVAAAGAWVGGEADSEERTTGWVVRGWGPWLGPLVLGEGERGGGGQGVFAWA
ncbi:uncharacterized protein LTHEOB_6043 [Neofusicoccum parvum]|nr:uncharacterized protein LTHEOB_6043 [Neofusicoccum parvum]